MVGQDGAHPRARPEQVAAPREDPGGASRQGEGTGAVRISFRGRFAGGQGLVVSPGPGEQVRPQVVGIVEAGVEREGAVEGLEALVQGGLAFPAEARRQPHPRARLARPAGGQQGKRVLDLVGRTEGAGILFEPIPGPAVAGLAAHGVHEDLHRPRAVRRAILQPERLGERAAVGHVQRGGGNCLLQHPPGVRGTTRPAMRGGEAAAGLAVGGIDTQRTLQGGDLGGVVVPELLDRGEVQPDPRQERKPVGGSPGVAVGGREASRVGMLPDDGGPRLPQIGPHGEEGVELRLEFGFLQQGVRARAVGEDPIPDERLADEFPVHEGQCRPLSRHLRRGPEQAGQGAGQVGIECQRPAQAVSRGLAFSGVEQHLAAHGMGGRAERLEQFGLVERREGGGKVAVGAVSQGALALRPRVGGLDGEQRRDGGDVLGGAAPGVVHQGADAQLVQRDRVREADEDPFEMLFRGGAAAGIDLRQQAEQRPVRGGVERLAHEEFAAVRDGGGRVAGEVGQFGGGPGIRRGQDLPSRQGQGARRQVVLPVAAVDRRGEEPQFAVVRPAAERLLQHGGGRAEFVPLAVRPMQRARRLRGLAAQATEARVQQLDGAPGFPQVAAGHEELLPAILADRGAGRGEAEDGGRLAEVALVAVEGCQQAQVLGFGWLPGEAAREQLPGAGPQAGVGGKLAGEFPPEVRFRVGGFRRAAFQPSAGLGGARQAAQDREFFQPQPTFLGKERQQGLHGAERGGIVTVVVGQLAPGQQGDARGGSKRLQGSQRGPGGRPVVDVQRAALAVEPVEPGGFGQVGRVETGGRGRIVGRHDGHRARTAEGESLEKLLGQSLRLVALVGIAEDQRAAPGVVTDDRLQVPAVDGGRGQGEGDAAVQQGDGARPVGAEFTDDPAVGFRPVPLLVVERAAVADGLRDGRLVGGPLPEAGQGGERGGSARPLVLPDERHGVDDAAGLLALRIAEALDALGVEKRGGHQRFGRVRRAGEIPELEPGLAPARSRPVEARFFLEQAQGFEAVQRQESLRRMLEFDLDVGQLPGHAGALDVSAGRVEGAFQQVDRLLVAPEQGQDVGGGLDRGTKPRLQPQGFPRGFERFGVAVGGDEQRAALAPHPGTVGRQGARPLPVEFRRFGVPERRGDAGLQAEDVGPGLPGRAVEIGLDAGLPEKAPQGERTAPAKKEVSVKENRAGEVGGSRHGVRRGLPSGAQDQHPPQTVAAEVAGQSAAEEAGGRTRPPVSQRAMLFDGKLMRGHIAALIVERFDFGDLAGANLGGMHIRTGRKLYHKRTDPRKRAADVRPWRIRGGFPLASRSLRRLIFHPRQDKAPPMRFRPVPASLVLRGWLALLAGISGWPPALSAGEPANPPPVRIAVVGDADTANLAALVTAELSGDAGIHLLDREELARVGDELKLRQLAGSDAVALGKLIGADGLVFLRRGEAGPQVRLTSVGMGYALFDEPVGAAADPPQAARALAHQVEAEGPKLRLSPAQAVPISVLNLRAEYATEASAALERRLTLLVESRLASLPAYVVLERRHAWSLNFERSLAAESPALLPGAYIVDGTLTTAAPGTGEVTVHLRLRSTGRPETPLEISGSTDDLAGLSERITAAIRRAIGSAGATAEPPPWQPQKEAREYLLEGIWGEQHHVGEAALEALDSAELLGETAPDLLAMRIPALCARASGTVDLNVSPRPALKDEGPIGPRVEAWERALRDVTRYTQEKGQDKLLLIDPVRTGDGRTGSLRADVTGTGSTLLVLLDQTGRPEAGEVRTALRTLNGFDPTRGKLAGNPGDALTYADDWCVSLDEELAYYRKLWTTLPWAAEWGWQLQWTIRPDRFCARFLPTVDAQRTAYFQFVRSLLDDPLGRPLALLALARWAGPGDKAAACRTLYDTVWDQREDLLKLGSLYLFVTHGFRLEKERRVPVADPKLIALLRLELQRTDDFHESMAQTWEPELFPADEAAGIWQDWQDWQKRFRAKHPNSGGYLPSMNQKFIARFGEPGAAEHAAEPLAVRQFWYAPDAPRRILLATNALCPVADGVWLAGLLDGERAAGKASQGVLYHVGLDPRAAAPFAAGPRIDVPQASIQDTAALPDALYLLCRTPDKPPRTTVDRYDLAAGTWTEHEVPGADRIYAAGGQLYLTLTGADSEHREGGVARYDGRTGEITLLASSRRRPAQNPFDDRAAYRVNGVFTGPGGKPCASIEAGSYFINDQPGPWAPLTQEGVFFNVRTQGGRTLLYGSGSYGRRSDAAVLIDPAQAGPEAWLGPLEPLPKRGAPGSEPAEMPAWARHTVWTQEENSGVRSSDYGFRDGDLFALLRGNGKDGRKLELAWYRRGGPAAPVRIPLHFEMDEAAVQALKAVLSVNSNTFGMVREPDKTPFAVGMTVAPQGICFKAIIQGFWFLPFTDIDAYLKSSAATPPPAR